MKRVVVVLLACFVMIVMASRVFAQPCEEEIAKFCSDVKRGEGRILNCLDQHKIELSDKCKTYFEDVQQEFKEAYKTCENDIMTFCQWIQSGEGRILDCMNKNKSQLSEDCKDSLYKYYKLK
jgi:hypothetical protein